MTAPITESWIRIESWLAANAPATFRALAPPADRSRIAAAEEATGLAFPDEVRESLLRHDGTDAGPVLLPPIWELLSADGIAEAWNRQPGSPGAGPQATSGVPDEDGHPGEGDDEDDEDDEDLYEDVGEDFEGNLDEADSGPLWHPQWLPFASSVMGDLLVVDLRPTRLRGRIGDACHGDLCQFREHPRWSSLRSLFEMTATALETGGPLEGCEPFVTGKGELEWELVTTGR